MRSFECFSYQNTEGSLSLDPLDLLISIGVSFALRSFPQSPRPSLWDVTTASEGDSAHLLRRSGSHMQSSAAPLLQRYAGLGVETSFLGLLAPVTSHMLLSRFSRVRLCAAP